jgi:ATP-dependent DNA helicase DinG
MPRRVTPAEIEAVFAEDGPLSTLMPGYKPRRSQIDMALAVARCLDTSRGRLAVEAGTGTGKSLAYLVPALLSEKRVVVATGTKALQDQLVDKDAPIAVKAVAAIRGDAAVEQPVMRMKGRTNYLCKLRYESFDRQGAFGFEGDDDNRLVQLKRFATTTTTGDRAELVGLPDSFSLWSDLDANKDACLGQACPRYDECFVVLMRRQAEKAAVIVVNHHLLCADQRLRLESGNFDDGDQGFGVLPVMDALVVDEAHALPDVATDHFGLSVSTDEVGRLLVDVRKQADACGAEERASLMDAVDEVGSASSAFFLAAGNHGKREGARDSLRPGDVPRGERLSLLGSDELKELGEGVNAAIEVLGDVLDAARTTFLDDGVEATMVKAALTGLKERSSRLRATLSYLAGPAASDKQYVCFVDKSPRGVSLTAAPIDVRAPLSGTLFAGDAPVILTSATLAVGHTIEPFLFQVGLVNDAAEVSDDAEIDDDDSAEGGPVEVQQAVFASPFDHARRAALYAPADMPEPDQPTWGARYDDEVRFLLALSKGGALLLFTSHRAMEDAATRLRPALDELGIVMLKQGDRPKGVLLDELRANGNAALFATSSFWEGVDVGGAALRLVIIDRLPFRVPSDPLVRARAEHARSLGKDPFADLAVPEAALTLKQGAGRLLRTVNDAGVVAVLDGRLRRRRYGTTFLDALPPMTRVGARRSVAQFWIRFVEPALGLPPTSPADAGAT